MSIAAVTSFSDRSAPPVTHMTTAVACDMGVSIKGHEMAARAASAARFLPPLAPMPMMALPALAMTARTSAKSTLIMPGFTMISEIPITPWSSIWSATMNASETDVSFGTTSSRRSFETTISVSTAAWRSAMDRRACCSRLRPSNLKGLVTTPTVSAPSSFAMAATMGAAPEPVPPPMPAVTKTMSAPAIAAAISARDSSAAAAPTALSPPAPKPRVVSRPMFIVFGALDLDKACASVFMAQKSTFSMPAVSTMRFTAFPPPPPTPTTRMQHGAVTSKAPSAVMSCENSSKSSTVLRSALLRL
mmetsp:Transcript_10359/g.34285  ORF Transcript_10359/g.34285 Transcript_10359/m.34285 type:complete len:303 (+) Transcript_10359:321-1229(+)